MVVEGVNIRSRTGPGPLVKLDVGALVCASGPICTPVVLLTNLNPYVYATAEVHPNCAVTRYVTPPSNVITPVVELYVMPALSRTVSIMTLTLDQLPPEVWLLERPAAKYLAGGVMPVNSDPFPLKKLATTLPVTFTCPLTLTFPPVKRVLPILPVIAMTFVTFA